MPAALETLCVAYRERDRAARAWKAAGGRVVGYLCDNIPEELILAEAARLVRLPHWRIADRWHGIYSLHPEQDMYAETLHGRIHLLTGLFGKGMTVGPALAREAIDRISSP